jgi:hypothetical protein
MYISGNVSILIYVVPITTQYSAAGLGGGEQSDGRIEPESVESALRWCAPFNSAMGSVPASDRELSSSPSSDVTRLFTMC